ncbi:MAG: hypothetical protein R3E00_13640 [Paracoccaceae bacterium]
MGAGLIGTFYLFALYMQVLLLGPVMAGVAALPFSVGIIAASILASKLVVPPRTVVEPGLVIAAASSASIACSNSLRAPSRMTPVKGSGEDPPLGRLLRNRLPVLDGPGRVVMVSSDMWHVWMPPLVQGFF